MDSSIDGAFSEVSCVQADLKGFSRLGREPGPLLSFALGWSRAFRHGVSKSIYFKV